MRGGRVFVLGYLPRGGGRLLKRAGRLIDGDTPGLDLDRAPFKILGKSLPPFAVEIATRLRPVATFFRQFSKFLGCLQSRLLGKSTNRNA